jgi:hypothetical protein
VATNTSFEDAGAAQGEADGWTTTTTGDAQGYAAIEAGDGLLYAWEGFDGWVAGQDEYRFDGFEAGDTTAGTAETFEAWSSGQNEYRLTGFGGADTTAGNTETFEAWQSGQGDYRFDGFEGGDTTAGSAETFASWVADQSEYRAAFDVGDTTTGTFHLGASTTGAAETFEGCRTDVAVQATASSSTIAAAGHAFSVNDPAQLTADGSLFAPFQKGIRYYVKTVSAGVSVTLSATLGGSAITATETGEATLIGDPAYFWANPRSAW